MTTNTYSAVIDQTTDAAFRAWGSGLAASLASAGLVQTSDTGQINWASVTRPGGTNAAAGYEIWRFPDSSLYVKIEYGNGSSTSTPNLWVTVGTGSNGSGTITGQTSTRSTWARNLVPTSTVTAYNTYVSVTDDWLAICFGLNSSSTSTDPMGLLVVAKSVDSDGVATNDGFHVMRMATTGFSCQSVRIAAVAATYNDTAMFTIVPGAPTSSLIAGVNQAWLSWGNLPDMRPIIAFVTYVNSEAIEGTSFDVAMLGGTTHTYLAVGQINLNGPTNTSASTYAIAMIYE